MHYKTQLEWLVTLARLPAWKAQAWHRAQELEKDQTGLWKGIESDLIARVTGRAGVTACAAQPLAKPR